MSRDDLFATEEEVIATGEQLLADGGFARVEDRQKYALLLKSYQKLFRVTRRLMRLSDNNERQLSEAAELIAQKNKELEALSTKLSKYLSPQIYNSIFTGAQNVEIASLAQEAHVFFSDMVNFTETTDKLESEELTNLLNHYLDRDVEHRAATTAPPSTNISATPSWCSSAIPEIERRPRRTRAPACKWPSP